MKEYLINSGNFNIMVVPGRRHYYLLGRDEVSTAVVAKFVAGEAIAGDELEPHWFKYAAEELWTGFDGEERQFDEHFGEADLIDHFVLKKFNSGSLVAVREAPGGKVQIFKPDKLSIS